MVTKRTKEPTLGEFFTFVKKGFAGMEKRFDLVDERAALLDKKIDHRFALSNERMNSIDARLGDIQRQVNKTQVMVADVQDDLTTLGAALDQDSERVVDHEVRIKKLEAAQA